MLGGAKNLRFNFLPQNPSGMFGHWTLQKKNPEKVGSFTIL